MINKKKVKCDLCGSSSFTILFKKENNIRILKCLYCGIVFIWPQTIEGKELRDFYQQNTAFKNSDSERLHKRINRLKSSLGELVLTECYGYPARVKRENILSRKVSAHFLKCLFL